jgi:4-hydroxybenzoate polyprenyltransferase
MKNHRTALSEKSLYGKLEKQLSMSSMDSASDSRLVQIWRSARIALWPAIILNVFAISTLAKIDGVIAVVVSVIMCLTATFAFVFNDQCDKKIDERNGVCRWVITSKLDYFFAGTYLAFFILVLFLSHSVLSASSLAWLWSAVVLSLLYSLCLKKIPFVGNLSAAFLVVSPMIILLSHDLGRLADYSDLLNVCLLFILAQFLFTMSREAKFDEFDIHGDRDAGRVTLPVVFHRKTLSVYHAVLNLCSVAAIFLGLCVFSERATVTWQKGTLLFILLSVFCFILVISYRSESKAVFYKLTRAVMVVFPAIIFSLALS